MKLNTVTGDSTTFTHSFASKKLIGLQLGIFFAMGCLIAAIGASSYLILRSYEFQALNDAFSSSVDNIIKTISSNTQSKVNAAEVIGNIYSYAADIEYAGKLPNITIIGFEDIMSPMLALANARAVAFNPLLTKKNRRQWESYAAAHVDLLKGPQSLKKSVNGSWTVFKGIYNKTISGRQEYDSGYATGSKYPELLTPVWQVCPISSNAGAVMHNTHAMRAGGRMEAVDRVISTLKPSCTDIVQLVQDKTLRPSILCYNPVLSRKNKELIALSSVAYNWDSVFDEALPAFLSGVHLVLSSATQTFTFLLSKGQVTLVGRGDSHDTRFDHYKRTVSESIKELATGSLTDITITLYPTHEFRRKYITNLPTIACCTVVAAIVLTTALVLLYMRGVSQRDRAMLQEVESSTIMANFAKEELEIKKSFVRYISHEIRTPLNTVMMGLEVLRQDIAAQRPVHALQQTLSDISGSCDTAMEIVNDFLLFDKIVTAKLEMELHPVDLVDVVRCVVETFQVQARRCETTLAVSMEVNEEENEFVQADPHKLMQVLRNMVSNALKFTPKGGRITVRVRKKTADESSSQQKRFIVDVVDTGVGISKENQSKLFQNIVQFNPGKLQNGGGSGLGMYISYSIMTQLGGDLSVHSDGEGSGTTFSLSIPALSSVVGTESEQPVLWRESPSSSVRVDMNPTMSEDGKDELLSVPRSDASEHSDSDDHFRILVVDDAASNRKMLCRLITGQLHCVCIEANDGKQAVELVKQSLLSSGQSVVGSNHADEDTDVSRTSVRAPQYDVILIDFTMPLLTGPEATRLIRGLGYRGLIVGITGHTDEQARDLFLSNGANDVLIKPVDNNVLSNLITSYPYQSLRKERRSSISTKESCDSSEITVHLDSKVAATSS